MREKSSRALVSPNVIRLTRKQSVKIGAYEVNQIYNGDSRELINGIPDNLVDLIFTNPVYENVVDYRWLSEID